MSEEKYAPVVTDDMVADRLGQDHRKQLSKTDPAWCLVSVANLFLDAFDDCAYRMGALPKQVQIALASALHEHENRVAATLNTQMEELVDLREEFKADVAATMKGTVADIKTAADYAVTRNKNAGNAVSEQIKRELSGAAYAYKAECESAAETLRQERAAAANRLDWLSIFLGFVLSVGGMMAYHYLMPMLIRLNA